jgi:glycosyltransferase involved in cell wall biosynthesis
MKISLASPVYNESGKIQEFIHRTVTSLHQISNDIEIVLVNDCSQDDTASKIRELLPQYPCVKLISLTKNSGQHIATAIALQNTTGDFVFMMDSDLQVKPEYLVEFFGSGNQIQNWDIISALRVTRSSFFTRRIGSNIISYLLKKIGNTDLKDIGSTFKLIKRRALDRLLSQDILIQNLPILMLNLNLRIIEHPIEYDNMQERKSHYKVTDLVFAITLALLNFSTGSTTLILLVILGAILLFVGSLFFLGLVIFGVVNQSMLPTNFLIFFLVITVIGVQFMLMGLIVFKLERINKNLDFRRSINQRIEHDN